MRCRLLRPSSPVPLVLALALGLAGTGKAGAQITIIGADPPRLTLGGYLRSLTGLHDRGFDLPDADRRNGFHGEVVRLKWRGQAGAVVLDVHQRLQARITSAVGEGPVLGFGVSATPARSVDLSTDLVDQRRLRVWHDLDRLSLGVRTSVADFSAGRQPITWGTSSLFPVADLWAAFSPFELDTEEKPGIDALRALAYPAPALELDAVIADRGSVDHISAGIRATWSLASADLWAGGGKFWDRGMIMGGATLIFDETRVRGEAVLPFDQRPRLTVGMDWIRGRLSLTGEAHYNGTGAGAAGDYVETAQGTALARGESYFLGRYYLGTAASWAPDEGGRLRLALSALVNPADPSAAFTPLLDYELGAATSLSVGGLLSLGSPPVLDPAPRLPTEFGAYGDLVFTRVSIYF